MIKLAAIPFNEICNVYCARNARAAYANSDGSLFYWISLKGSSPYYTVLCSIHSMRSYKSIYGIKKIKCLKLVVKLTVLEHCFYVCSWMYSILNALTEPLGYLTECRNIKFIEVCCNQMVVLRFDGHGKLHYCCRL